MGRELGDPGLKPTVRVGEAALREVAAFLLDYKGFAKVRICHGRNTLHVMCCVAFCRYMIIHTMHPCAIE